MRAPIGLRISTRRKALGISQANLARLVNVSPSYLNLIEANKRQVGGTLLQNIATALQINIDELTGEAEHRLIHEIFEAFTDPVLAQNRLGLDAARQLVATSPEIAQIIATLYRAYTAAQTNADTYANRLRADPLLSQLLHQVLSGITAVRAGAEILTDVPDLSDTDRERFLSSILKETGNLSAVSRNLIGQFEQSSDAGRSVSTRRELDDMIFAARNYFPALEQMADELRADLEKADPLTEARLVDALEAKLRISVVRTARQDEGRAFGYNAQSRTLWFRNTVPQSTRQFQMAQLLAEALRSKDIEAELDNPILSSDRARQLARRYLAAYAAGAILFPYDRFIADAEQLRYDIDALSDRYNASFEQMAHRLVTLRRENAQGVPFGFLRSDTAGRLTKHFPLPGLLLPNSGFACPLWALYSAFRTPGQIVRQPVQFVGNSRFLFIAKAVAPRSSGFADTILPHSIMLAADILHADRTVYADGLDLADTKADTRVGPTCRLCTRMDCANRQEEPLSPDA